VERTLVLVKPDGVQRGLIGEVIARFERRGLRLVGAKFIQDSIMPTVNYKQEQYNQKIKDYSDTTKKLSDQIKKLMLKV